MWEQADLAGVSLRSLNGQMTGDLARVLE